MTEHIKINSIPPRIRYVADGTTTTFEFPFAIFKSADLKVYFGSSLQSANTYTVNIDTQNNCGSVSFLSAPANNTIITLNRELAIARTSDFQEGASMRADVLNDELDYQIACQQQITDALNRTMVLPPYAVNADVSFALPEPVAGKAIVWNSSGTNLENSTIEINALENTLKGYKQSAQSAASTASTAAETATSAASTATSAANAVQNKLNIDLDNLAQAGKAKILAFGLPDYSAGVSLTCTTTNTNFPIDGIAYFGYNGASNTSFSIYIDDQEFGTGGSSAANIKTQTAYRVSTDDVYRFQTTSSAGQYGIIFPLKGNQNA